MIRPLATFLRALDAARTAGTLARTVRVLARQLDNAHLLAASEGARADRAEAELADAEAYAAAIERSFSAEPAAHVLGCAENLHQCAASHEPGVRLLGNLTAREIAEVARLTLGQARRIAELEAQTRDWAELSGELAREQPADDALPSVLDAGEAPIPLALTDSAREADIQRDRADALQRALQACEVELATTREAKLAADIRADVQRERAEQAERERDAAARAAGAHLATIERLREELADALRDAAEARDLARCAIFTQEQPLKCRECGGPCEEDRRCYARPTCHRCLPPPPALKVFQLGGAQLRQTEAAAGAHLATIERLREQIAAAHRAAHAIAPADPPCQCGHPASVHGREGCGAPGEDTHACPCERFQVYGHHPRPAEQIPGVAAVGPCAEWSAEYDAIESARERAGTDDSPPTRPSERAATRTT